MWNGDTKQWFLKKCAVLNDCIGYIEPNVMYVALENKLLTTNKWL